MYITPVKLHHMYDNIPDVCSKCLDDKGTHITYQAWLISKSLWMLSYVFLVCNPWNLQKERPTFWILVFFKLHCKKWQKNDVLSICSALVLNSLGCNNLKGNGKIKIACSYNNKTYVLSECVMITYTFNKIRTVAIL